MTKSDDAALLLELGEWLGRFQDDSRFYTVGGLIQRSAQSLRAALAREAELRPIVAYVAALQDCDEDQKACDYDSGPRCNAHGDNYVHADMIAAARLATARASYLGRRGVFVFGWNAAP